MKLWEIAQRAIIEDAARARNNARAVITQQEAARAWRRVNAEGEDMSKLVNQPYKTSREAWSAFNSISTPQSSSLHSQALEKEFRCSLCSALFSEYRYLADHIEMKHESPKLLCLPEYLQKNIDESFVGWVERVNRFMKPFDHESQPAVKEKPEASTQEQINLGWESLMGGKS